MSNKLKIGDFLPLFFIKLNDKEKLFEEWTLYDWSEQAKIQEYKKELSTTDKKTRKIIMITFGMLTLRISEEKKFYKQKLRNPVNRNYKEPCFLAIEKQVNIQSAILYLHLYLQLWQSQSQLYLH